MSDGHHVARACEDMGLAELNLAILELRRAQHNEEGIAIDFELRPLMRRMRILNGEVMQAKPALNAAQQSFIRLMEPNPHEPSLFCIRALGLLKINFLNPAAPVIYGRVDDHAHLFLPAFTHLPVLYYYGSELSHWSSDASA